MKELISGHISISLPTEIKDDDWRALKRQMNETSEQGFLVDQLRLVLPNKRCDAALEDDDPEEVETRNMVTLLNVRPVSVILRLRSPDQLLEHLNVDRLSELIIHDCEKFAEAQACALLGKCVHLQKLTLSSSRADLVLHESFVPTVSTLKQLTELTLDVSIPAESYQQLPTTLQELTLSNLSSKVSITHITGLNRLILKAPSCEPSTLLDIANMPDLEQLEIIYTSNNALAAEAHAALWPALSVLGSLTFDWLDNVALSPSVAAGIAAATQISHLVIKIKDIPASLDLGDVLMPLQNLQHLALKLDFYNAPLSSFAELLNKATKLTTLELSWPSLPLLQLKQVYNLCNLQRLVLHNKKVGDEGLLAIRNNMKKLTILDVTDCNVTKKGVRKAIYNQGLPMLRCLAIADKGFDKNRSLRDAIALRRPEVALILYDDPVGQGK